MFFKKVFTLFIVFPAAFLASGIGIAAIFQPRSSDASTALVAAFCIAMFLTIWAYEWFTDKS